jgi:hypothetical protein
MAKALPHRRNGLSECRAWRPLAGSPVPRLPRPRLGSMHCWMGGCHSG